MFIAGCGAEVTPGGPGDTTGGGGTTGAISFSGSVAGTVSKSISSSDSASTVPPASWSPKVFGKKAKIRPAAAASTGTITFKDLDGNPLKDAQGNEYPPVSVNADGTFEAEGLPVGIDFIIEVDLDGDGEADLTHIVSIPKDQDGQSGSIEGIDVNPLTTMAVGKLLSIIESKGVTASDLDFSPAAIIKQMIDAFSALFEAMGIDSTLTADQIMASTIEALAEAFDRLVPDNIKAAMDMATSQLDIAGAETAEEVVLAVIPALLRAGICVADEPGGTELDSIAAMANVEVLTWAELWGPPTAGEESNKPPPEPEGSGEENRIFKSTVVEVDRNFATWKEEGGHGPNVGLVVHKHALERMAGLEMEGKTLSLRNLRTLATDLERGMGMRLSYGIPMPPPPPGEPFDPGPPTMIFQSEDQRGVEVDIQAMEEQIRSIMDQGSFNYDQRASQEAAVRAILKDILGGTKVPEMEQLFGGIVSDEPVTIESLSVTIRNARSHLPFNWSGDAKMYVLADHDRWRNDDAAAVTVDIEFDQDGQLSKVTYDPEGQGAHYLRCWGDSQWGYITEVIVASTGRMVHDKTGRPVQGFLDNQSIFGDVTHPTTGSQVSFLEAFSETGEFWPIEPALSVSNPWFNPEQEPDPNTNPPTLQMHVLVTQPGPDGEVVTVSVADNDSVVRDESGNYALDMFWEGPPVNGMMAVLTDTRTGQRLRRTIDGRDEEFRVLPQDIVGLEVTPELHTQIFDIDVANPMYNPEGDPWYDDVNENGQWDAGELTFSWKEQLWNSGDWRSTNVEVYYRRSDNDQSVRQRDVDFSSETPRTFTGVALVPRNFKRRNNAFTFGRPNSAISLLTAFLSNDFFDGTHKLNGDTRVSAFGALAIMNLIFDARLYNLEAYIVDYGPDGARPAELQIVEAWPWTPPLDDPVMLVVKGFEELATD